MTKADALNAIIQGAGTGSDGRDLTGYALTEARVAVLQALSDATPAVLRAVCDLNYWDTEGGPATLRRRIMAERFCLDAI